MITVVLTVASGVVGYLLDAVLVGALLAIPRLRSGQPIPTRWLFPGLLIVFAILDLYWFPAVLALDLTLKIGNPRAAAVFGSELSGAGLVTLGWFEILVWAVQGLVALWVADRISGRARVAI